MLFINIFNKKIKYINIIIDIVNYSCYKYIIN